MSDPTEQHNVHDANPDVVARLSQKLAAFKGGFFQNHDKFEDDCPALPEGVDCACWMAKERYGGFMGPYALLGS